MTILSSGAPELILLDGSSYLHRAHFSLPPIDNAQGEPTGAIYGVINMLLNLIRQQSPQYIGVIFDASGQIMRDGIRAEYNVLPRTPPEELCAQIEPLIEVVDAMGLPMLRIEGQEADDVIGTLACQAVDQGIGVTISTCDKDMAQLVDDCILLVNSLTGEMFDRERVKE